MEQLGIIFERLREYIPELQVDGDKAYLKELALSISASVETLRDDDDLSAVAVHYRISLPFSCEALSETCATTGADLEAALKNAAVNFYAGILSNTIDFLQGKSDDDFSTNFCGKKNDWRMTESNLVLMGKSSPTESYWGRINEGVKKRLGNGGFYYIKVFVAKQADGEIITEVRINDVLSRELSQLLEDYAGKLNNESFCSQKQFFFIEQISVYDAYPYTREQIKDFVKDAVLIFADCNSDGKYENLRDDITEKVGDRLLACELRSFLPEICAEHHFPQMKYAETITLIKGEEQIEVYRSRISSYEWIKGAVIDGFLTGGFPESAYGLLVSLSAIYNVTKQIKEKGSKLENASVVVMTEMPDYYTVR